jgi:AraC family transcriptional regulator
MGLGANFDLQFDEPHIGPRQRQFISCAGFEAEHVSLDGTDGFSLRVGGNSHYLAIHDIQHADAEMFFDGVGHVTPRDIRNTITFVPRGFGATGWSKPARRPNTVTVIHFDPDILSQELGARYRLIELQPLVHIRNPGLEQTLLKVRSLLQEGGTDTLYAEALCMAAAVEVTQCSRLISSGRLSKWQAITAESYVESNFAKSVTISQIAQAVGLSRFHFARCFRSTFGTSPYSYIVSVRIEKSKEMLLSTRIPIGQIATTVGFNSASQFGRSFRKVVGCAPETFRRNLG